jgi:hypothetical protein
LGTGWRFAGATTLSHLGFPAQIAFATIIGRFNLRVLDEDE